VRDHQLARGIQIVIPPQAFGSRVTIRKAAAPK